MSLRRKFHSSDLRGVAKVLLGAKRRRRWTWAGDSIRAAGGRCGQENKWAVENEMIITHRMSYSYSFHFTSPPRELAQIMSPHRCHTHCAPALPPVVARLPHYVPVTCTAHYNDLYFCSILSHTPETSMSNLDPNCSSCRVISPTGQATARPESATPQHITALSFSG